METPPEDVRRPEAEEETPDFSAWDHPEEVVSGDRTRDDFLDVALQLRDPTPVSDIADRAGRGEDAAREYMEFFETIGLVRRYDGRPTRYEVNRDYLRWRRIERLRDEYTDAELVEQLDRVNDAIRSYREQFDADAPAEVSPTARADATGRSTEAVWRDLSDWKSAEVRRALLEAALHHHDPLSGLDRRLTA